MDISQFDSGPIALRNYHININQLNKTDDAYIYFRKNCKCNHSQQNCPSYRRNTRDREKCRDATYRRGLYFLNINDKDDIKEINLQNLLDTIHSSLIHYDVNNMILSGKFVTNFKITENKHQQQNDQKNDHDQENDEKADNAWIWTNVLL